MKKHLKSIREELRFSQSELARRSGVSRVRICLHELGDLSLSDTELGRIERALRAEVQRVQEASRLIA